MLVHVSGLKVILFPAARSIGVLIKMNKVISTLTAFILVFAASFSAFAINIDSDSSANQGRVRVPLNLAVLIQDDLVSRVGNELEVTRQFIRQLPEGSRVMVAYVTAGSLSVRQQFTTDREAAAKSLRLPVGSSAASPFNPYVEVREALKKFPSDGTNANALLLVSDGLDASRGIDFSSSVDSIDLARAAREAQRRGVAIFSFYAPTRLTESNRRAALLGQSALNRLTKETGGQAFFQGSDFVSFDPYFRQLSRALNLQFGGPS